MADQKMSPVIRKFMKKFPKKSAKDICALAAEELGLKSEEVSTALFYNITAGNKKKPVKKTTKKKMVKKKATKKDAPKKKARLKVAPKKKARLKVAPKKKAKKKSVKGKRGPNPKQPASHGNYPDLAEAHAFAAKAGGIDMAMGLLDELATFQV